MCMRPSYNSRQAGRQAGWMRRVGVSLCGTVTRCWDACPVRTHCALPACQRQPDGNVGKAKPPVRSCIFKPRGEIKRPFGHLSWEIGRRSDTFGRRSDGGGIGRVLWRTEVRRPSRTSAPHWRAYCLAMGGGSSRGRLRLICTLPVAPACCRCWCFCLCRDHLQSARIHDVATCMRELCSRVGCYRRRPGSTACGYRIRLSFFPPENN